MILCDLTFHHFSWPPSRCSLRSALELSTVSYTSLNLPENTLVLKTQFRWSCSCTSSFASNTCFPGLFISLCNYIDMLRQNERVSFVAHQWFLGAVLFSLGRSAAAPSNPPFRSLIRLFCFCHRLEVNRCAWDGLTILLFFRLTHSGFEHKQGTNRWQ